VTAGRGSRGSRGKGGKGTVSSRRGPRIKVKPKKRRKPSSTRWLARHLNDPYVREAKAHGFRSRAAFKLIQIDDRFHLLKRGARVVDLGAAPGGWTQIAAERTGAAFGEAPPVVAVDVLAIAGLPGVTALEADIDDPDVLDRIRTALGGCADVVLSDMAPATTGHAATDHLRIVHLCERALDVATALLRPGGAFVVKVFQGGAQGELLARLKRHFKSVRHAKPAASRAESPETYVVAQGFRPDSAAGGGLDSTGSRV
jgi:23S rRNA (uridine2552-2'-O)-methyltransferase